MKIRKTICMICKKDKVCQFGGFNLLACYNCYERKYNNKSWKEIKGLVK